MGVSLRSSSGARKPASPGHVPSRDLDKSIMLRELQFISPKMGRTEPVKVALATKMTNVTYIKH